MQIPWSVDGIACVCEVVRYVPAQPMRITGSGFGDAEPPSALELEYRLLDQSGNLLPEDQQKLQESEEIRLICQLRRFFPI